MKPLAILPALILLACGTAFAAPHHSMRSHMPACKGATVYAISTSHSYYTKGESMYGRAKGGKYMCMAAANRQGYHHWVAKKNSMKSMKHNHKKGL